MADRVVVVDTDVLSRMYRADPLGVSYANLLRDYQGVVSFMTLAEIRRGAVQANWGERKCAALERFAAQYAVIHSDDILCDHWAAIMCYGRATGRPMGTADAWIAATASRLGAPLATHNAKHFAGLPGLELMTV